jgi:DNA polymerase-1
MRSRAKTITFGLAYGKGAYGFAKDFGIEEDEAQELVDNYFRGMSKLKEAIAKAHKEVEETGKVTSMAGRVRHFNIDKDTEFWIVEKAKRQSFNFQIQGFSADMIRAASINVMRRNIHPEWGLKAVMTIHDEFVYICKEDYIKESTYLVKRAFEDVCKNFVVPVNADVEIGTNYGNSK